jgi:DNA helicase II / ATP-dependent DNA helicase PcrA
MNKTLLSQLNISQQKAMVQTDGPILILAGAGSGKTRVLTFKVVYLMLEKNIPGSDILMVTFTNKAAAEMKKRIQTLLSHQQSSTNHRSYSHSLPYAGTFHALCAKILRKDGFSIGIPVDFLIYDDQDTKEAIKQALIKLEMDPKKVNPAACANLISSAKNELISASQYQEIARGYFQKIVSSVYFAYQEILVQNHALDFDDLLFYTVKLLRQDKNTADKYQTQFRYVLIDEYQDTNHAQYQLTRLLCQKWNNICVVGDASQSIYAWRGADFRNIVNFKKDYPDTKVFQLEQNYRSTQIILDAATAVISKNSHHPILNLWTENEQGPLIQIYNARNEQDEALFILSQITRIRFESHELKLSDFAILYRTNAQSRVFEEAFLHQGIPYILVGGVRFYERKEIKDVLSYLRLLSNPRDSIARKRIEKIGKRRLIKFDLYADEFLAQVKNKEMPTLTILDTVLEKTGYFDIFNKENEEDQMRLENIKELRSVADQFPNLTSFLENVSLVEQEYTPLGFIGNDNEKKDAVTLMTMHAAKGLEFHTVFIVGMEEGLFPHSRTLLEPLELEEERRLCYVGITRAKENLFLSYASRRLYFGQRTSNVLSRFIVDIPQHLIRSSTHNYDI